MTHFTQTSVIKKKKASKMSASKKYDEEYKKQAIKPAKKVGTLAAAKEPGISKNTLHAWVGRANLGKIYTGDAVRSPEEWAIEKEIHHVHTKNYKRQYRECFEIH